MPTLVWFESDLRIRDHAALRRAADRGEPILPVFAWDGGAGWASGGASRWWLHHSLVALRDALGELGLPLVVRRGDPATVLGELAAETGATTVTWNARLEPERRRRDTAAAERLRAAGLGVHVFAGQVLHDPDVVRTSTGGPFQVFTPFWKRLASELRVASPYGLPPIGTPHRPAVVPSSLAIGDLGLLPRPDWAGGLREAWKPGESGALERLDHAARSVVPRYADERNRPDLESTSRLSPHLHFGEVTPRQAWHAVRGAVRDAGEADAFLRQLVWREFAFHLLHHFPTTPAEPLRPEFASFPWRDDPGSLRTWQRGETGYPIVDAGMRELWHTGWMHNRVRMIAASFLTKDLLVPWTRGAEWFEDTLVDADLANNTFGWQWTAGCGADAQPFFRVFNPSLQGRRFDPDGAYVRRWLPELGRMPAEHVHEPWKAPASVLAAAGVVPGRTYPLPVVPHDEARARALAAYRRLAPRGAG